MVLFGHSQPWCGYIYQFSMGFKPLLISPSQTTRPAISPLLLIRYSQITSCILSKPHTKTFALEQKSSQGRRSQAEATGSEPVEVAFPKTPAAHPNSPASPQHAYKSPQLCQRTRNASWKPFPCNRSWV